MNSQNKLSRLSIDLPPKLQKKLKALAALQGKSMREVVISSIEKQVEKLEKATEGNILK